MLSHRSIKSVYQRNVTRVLYFNCFIEYAGQVYQKKVKVDKDIIELVGDMDDVLSFVEDVDVLKDKLTSFTSTIEQILLTIDSCCSWVKKYLETNTPGMTFDEVPRIF